MTNHDANGRFVKGNQAAKGHSNGKTGRPSKEREQRFYDITLSTVTYADWRDVVKRAVKQAKLGDHQARMFLAKVLRLMVDKQEITGADGGPQEIVLTLADGTPLGTP